MCVLLEKKIFKEISIKHGGLETELKIMVLLRLNICELKRSTLTYIHERFREKIKFFASTSRVNTNCESKVESIKEVKYFT